MLGIVYKYCLYHGIDLIQKWYSGQKKSRNGVRLYRSIGKDAVRFKVNLFLSDDASLEWHHGKIIFNSVDSLKR